jgi:hypothetical protein
MPVNVSRIEARIYRYQVVGSVTIDELRSMIQSGIEMAEAVDENPHIRIIDAAELKRIPIDMRELIRLVSAHKNDILQTLVVQAPSAARVMVQGVKLFVPNLQEMAFHIDMDAALTAARSYLAETVPDPDSR